MKKLVEKRKFLPYTTPSATDITVEPHFTTETNTTGSVYLVIDEKEIFFDEITSHGDSRLSTCLLQNESYCVKNIQSHLICY